MVRVFARILWLTSMRRQVFRGEILNVKGKNLFQNYYLFDLEKNKSQFHVAILACLFIYYIISDYTDFNDFNDDWNLT